MDLSGQCNMMNHYCDQLKTAYLLSTDRENEANKMYIILYAAG